MRFRHIFTYFLMAAFLVPAWGQNTAGSSIASKTLLSSDGVRKVEQRVYDNGLGDIVQMITRTVPVIDVPMIDTPAQRVLRRLKK